MSKQHWAVAEVDGEIIEASTARGGFLAKAIFERQEEAEGFMDRCMQFVPDLRLEIVKVQVAPVARRDYVPGSGLPWGGGMG